MGKPNFMPIHVSTKANRYQQRRCKAQDVHLTQATSAITKANIYQQNFINAHNHIIENSYTLVPSQSWEGHLKLVQNSNSMANKLYQQTIRQSLIQDCITIIQSTKAKTSLLFSRVASN